jgi:hypothetical protein
MALTPREQRLYDVAKASLPSWFFLDETNAQEQIRAAAKLMGQVWDQADFWVDQAFMLRAVDIFVDQHAKDRGTRRQDGESTASLVKRLRNIEDSVTAPALLQHVKDILAANSAPSSPVPQLIELRADKLYFGRRVHFTPVDGAHLNDGETFTVATTVFEFDNNGLVTGGHVAVPFSPGDDLLTVALSMWTTITGQGYECGIDSDDTLYVDGAVTYGETVVDAGFVAQVESLGYLNCGYRLGKNAEPRIIVVLPYGTPDAAAQAVVEAMRLYKAGGVNVTVETRLVP